MKKFIALLLSAALLVPFGALSAFAAEPAVNPAFADGENSLIVFVTGIGQSWSYLFDDSYLAEDAFATGDLHDFDNYAPLIAEGKYTDRWNLFNTTIGDNLKHPEAIRAAAKIIVNLLASIVTRKNTVKRADVDALVRQLFKYNLVDENGKCDPHVITPRYTMPVSEYPGVINENGVFESEARDRFFRSIPCEEICREKLGENYADYLYCYNYCAFSYTSQNVEGLHDFIETILANNKVGAEKVVLVPMSMGASVVSAYLYRYPQVADNHVRRVVSIVGCWQGSDIIYDLMTQRYADNSAQLFYNGIIGDLVGAPWGYLVNVLLRLFPKAGLRGLIDMALQSISANVILDAPSLAALVPPETYDEIRPMIASDKVLAETDAYHDAQVTLQSRMEALKAKGVTFSFLSGYGLPYGAITNDYKAFGFMYHAARTNSDEIINIDSTAPGTAYVPYDQQFADADGRELSPDQSIDIAGTWNKDASWFFHGQKHELEYNNTAIRLAIHLALGDVKTVSDCADPAGEYYFPQFNGARNTRSVTEDHIPALEKYLAKGGTLTPEQQALYDETLAMVNSNVNDYEADNALMERFYNMLVDLGIYAPGEAKNDPFGDFFNSVLKKNNDAVNSLVGAKGFLDFDRSCG